MVITWKNKTFVTLSTTEAEYVILEKNSKYLILTRHALREAKASSEDRKIYEQKEFVKRVLFKESTITNRQFHELWLNMTNIKVKKGSEFKINNFEDHLFIVVSGSLNLEYPWRRRIKLREIGEGSLFSTYMGRYFNTTGEKLKNE